MTPAVQAMALAVAIPATFTVSAWAAEATFGNVPVQPGAVVEGGRILVPDSSTEKPGDIGKRAHTHHFIFVANGQTSPGVVPNLTKQETPASLACVYKLVSAKGSNGCDPAVATRLSKSGSKVIGIVD